jgi:hypothetical protein
VTVTNVFGTVPCCRQCFPCIHSVTTLSVVISLHYRFLPTCLLLWKVLCLRPPSCSVVFEIYILAWGSKICFGLSDCAPGLLLMFPGLRCFCVWLIKFWQRYVSVFVWLIKFSQRCVSVFVEFTVSFELSCLRLCIR